MKKIMIIIFSVAFLMPLYAFETACPSGVAFVNVPDVLFSNPANYSTIQKTYLSVSYNKNLMGLNSETGLDSQSGYYPVDISSWSGAVITPIQKAGAMGFALAHYGFSQLYSLSWFYASFSAHIPHSQISLGATAKYFMSEHKQTVYKPSNDTTGFSFDIGTHFIFQSVSMGISILDLFSTDKGIERTDKFLPHYKMGVLYEWHPQFIEQIDILADFEFQNDNYNLSTTVIGYWIQKTIAARLGANFNYISLGASYFFKQMISFHYELDFYVSSFNAFNHKLSIGVQF